VCEDGLRPPLPENEGTFRVRYTMTATITQDMLGNMLLAMQSEDGQVHKVRISSLLFLGKT
jgi:hypothetical protein